MADGARDFSRHAYHQQRSVSRDAIDYPTVVIRAGQDPIDIRLIEASSRGFQARCGFARFERGEMLKLSLPLFGMIDAQVMWGLRGCFGGQFSLPLDARGYLDMLAAMTAAAPPS